MLEFEQKDLVQIFFGGRVLECKINATIDESFSQFSAQDSWLILAGNKIGFEGSLIDENYWMGFFC